MCVLFKVLRFMLFASAGLAERDGLSLSHLDSEASSCNDNVCCREGYEQADVLDGTVCMLFYIKSSPLSDQYAQPAVLKVFDLIFFARL